MLRTQSSFMPETTGGVSEIKDLDTEKEQGGEKASSCGLRQWSTIEGSTQIDLSWGHKKSNQRKDKSQLCLSKGLDYQLGLRQTFMRRCIPNWKKWEVNPKLRISSHLWMDAFSSNKEGKGREMRRPARTFVAGKDRSRNSKRQKRGGGKG